MRLMLPSTAATGSPKAIEAIAAAVYLPIPQFLQLPGIIRHTPAMVFISPEPPLQGTGARNNPALPQA